MPTTATRRLLHLTSVVTIAILIIGGITLWQTYETRASSDQIRESNLIAACRSELRAEIDLADAEINRLFLSGVYALAVGDTPELAAIAEHAQDALDISERAVAAYAEGVTLSRTDPAAFLASCRKEPQP